VPHSLDGGLRIRQIHGVTTALEQSIRDALRSDTSWHGETAMTVSSPWVKELGFQSPQAGGEGRAQDFLVVGQVFDTYIAVEFPDGTLSLVSELFSLKRKIEDSKTTGPLGGAARCRRKGQIRSSSGQLGKFQSKMGLPSGDCFR